MSKCRKRLAPEVNIQGMNGIPSISIDWDYFGNFFNVLATQGPLGAAWILFVSGGWIPFVILFLYAAKEVYMINLQRRWARKQKYVLLAVDVPKGNEQTPKAVEHIFSHFAAMRSSINFKEKYLEGRFDLSFSLEIVSHGGDVRFYIRVPVKFRDMAEAALYSQYPDVAITEAEDYVKEIPKKWPNDTYAMFGVDFKLDKPEFYPIRTYPQFEHTLSQTFNDPMSLIMETFSGVSKKEVLCFQIIATPTDDDWREKGSKAVKALTGRPVVPKKTFFDKALGLVGEVVSYATTSNAEKGPEKKDDVFRMLAMSPGERHTIEAIEMKLSKIGLSCKLRYVQYSPIEKFSFRYYAIKGFLKQFSALDCNSFSVVRRTIPKGDYWWNRMAKPSKQRGIMKAYAGRDWTFGGPRFVLNIEELATIWHFPIMTVKAPLVKKTEAKKAEPPRGLPIR